MVRARHPGDRNRWGDYSDTVVDPTDPYTFWTFQEWASAPDIWSTQITEIYLTVSEIPEPAGMLLALIVMAAGALRRPRSA